VKQQVAQIPWVTLVLTTGVTTLAGYAFIEMAKGVHRAVRRRREEEREEAIKEKNPPPKQLPPPGARPGGTFQLPMPGTSELGIAPRHSGFASPGHFGAAPGSMPGGHLTDVSTPVGELRHEFKSLQHNVDHRLARIEAMLAHQHGEVG
jgi:hypothetical protein